MPHKQYLSSSYIISTFLCHVPVSYTSAAKICLPASVVYPSPTPCSVQFDHIAPLHSPFYSWRRVRLFPLALLLFTLPGARGGLTSTLCDHNQILCDCEEASPPTACSDTSVILSGTGKLNN